MRRYHTRPELHFCAEIGLYITFGVRIYHHRRLLLHIPDVFYRRQQAIRFIRQCNREQPALVHIWELLEDAM